MDDDLWWCFGIICVHTVYKMESSRFFQNMIFLVKDTGIPEEKELRVLAIGVEPQYGLLISTSDVLSTRGRLGLMTNFVHTARIWMSNGMLNNLIKLKTDTLKNFFLLNIKQSVQKPCVTQDWAPKSCRKSIKRKKVSTSLIPCPSFNI